MFLNLPLNLFSVLAIFSAIAVGTAAQASEAGKGSDDGGVILKNARAQDEAVSSILILLDCSRQMAAEIPAEIASSIESDCGESVVGRSKYQVAQLVIRKLIAQSDSKTNVGIRVFGQVFRGDGNDCMQTTLVAPLAVGNRRTLVTVIDSNAPTGLSCLTYALLQAEKDVQNCRGPRSIVLISGSQDECGQEACEFIRKLAQTKLGVPVNVFNLSATPTATKVFSCIAEASGGALLSSKDISRNLSQQSGSAKSHSDDR